ncbi:MAG: hypothetical protein OXC94_06770 [Chloroflexi bacterium]|nr:hypothetical protein [Chloroflexota bacterium]
MTAGRGAGYALFGLAALLAAAAVASAWSGASRLAAPGEDAAVRAAADAAAASAAASAFVSAYGGFDYRDPDGYTARLAALSSGELRDAIARAAIDPAAASGQLRSRADVRWVAVEALPGAAAEATVRSLQVRSRMDPTTGRAASEEVTQQVRLQLVREGGRWLVTEVVLLGEEPAGARGPGREGS